MFSVVGIKLWRKRLCNGQHSHLVLFTTHFMDFHRRDIGICMIYSTGFQVYVLHRTFPDRVIGNGDLEATEF